MLFWRCSLPMAAWRHTCASVVLCRSQYLSSGKISIRLLKYLSKYCYVFIIMIPTFALYGIKDRGDYTQPSFTHDHNFCLMAEGKILQYGQLERISRRKYDNRLDFFLEDIMDSEQLNLPEIFDFVSVNSFVGKAFISKQGRVRFEPKTAHLNLADATPAQSWVQHKAWQGMEMPAYEVSHELAHVFSALPFYGDLHENSLLVHLDGGASVGNFSAFLYKNGVLQVVEAHWELSHISKFFNDNALAFALMGASPGEHCSVPGKLMGYAAMGTYRPEIGNWMRKNNYFKDIWQQPDRNRFFAAAARDFGIQLTQFDLQHPFLQDVAAVFQQHFSAAILAKIQALHTQTKAEYLYYAGGGALNIIANTQIINLNLFKDIFIPPCCNDSGLSIGGAAFLEWKKGNRIEKHLPYLNTVGIADCLEYTADAALIRQTAELLMQRKVVAVCNGAAEAGPRALGNRSLLALPDSPELTRRVSMDCKRREWFRPVAPVMLAHLAERVTGVPMPLVAHYMLADFSILPQYCAALAGVIHANHTARIQAIPARSFNPFLYDLLQYLYTNYGVLALINTSFNAAGEPIVHTATQALASAQEMGVDALVLNGILHHFLITEII